MEKTLLTAGILLMPTALVVVIYWRTGRRIEWRPLVWAGFAYCVYFVLMRSNSYIPILEVMAGLTLNWTGKVMSIVGTLAMICLLPTVNFQLAGLTWKQNKGSSRPILLAGVITLVSMAVTFVIISPATNSSLENIAFQITLPGPDEELFMRGLLLLLFHQAFGKGLNILGAETGWGFWLTVIIFGLLHGVTTQDGAFSVNLGAIFITGFMGFLFAWMRELSGSLVFPILFHNAVNTIQAFL